MHQIIYRVLNKHFLYSVTKKKVIRIEWKDSDLIWMVVEMPMALTHRIINVLPFNDVYNLWCMHASVEMQIVDCHHAIK